ncbi:major facilitator superfamily domain-containing protein [Podospora didyma]|uniref:Major facilitator superfamily domain-containing protein n=1 Tax=Podospora didyma TaxID=330526 RepID=A0AAE0NHA7_9PEZI|nr:major facilitator superfamily domain-containing protein [Podospora didyma]
MSTMQTDSDSKNEEGSRNTQSIKLDDEKQSVTDDLSNFPPAPDGGLEAWLVAAGGAALFFCCLGFANSFGSFEEYYLSHQLSDRSPDDIAWIGSLSAFLSFASGMVGGPLFDRYGAAVVRPAALAYVVSMMLLSLCNTYWQIMLVQGVLMGVLQGFLQFPAFAAAAQWFDKKRATALGIAVAGSSIGGIVFPIALSNMLNGSSLGFGWSVRVMGFVMIPFVAFACITVKPRLPSRKTKFWMPEAYRDIKFSLLIVAMFFLFFSFLTPIFFLPTYAVSRGINPTLAGYLLAILNAASTFGRVIPAILADKYGRLNAFALGGILTAVTIFCFNQVTNTVGFVAYAIFFGFASGTIISGASAAMSLCTDDPRNIGTYMGMGMSISGVGGLIGPPVSGAFVRTYGGFYEVAMFSGAMCLVGGLVTLGTKFSTPQGIFGRI